MPFKGFRSALGSKALAKRIIVFFANTTANSDASREGSDNPLFKNDVMNRNSLVF